jgi:hypothetical protein
MYELIDANPDVNIQEEEYKRLLGYPKSRELEGRSRELADWAGHWFNKNGKPWIYAIRTDEIDISSENLIIGNSKFASRKFRDMLAEANAFAIMLTIACAGKECEEEARKLWQEGKPDEYFFLETYGSAVAEFLVTIAGAHFCSWAEKNKFAILPHYSPGYAGWDVSDQKKVFELIEQKKSKDFPGKFNVLETGMLDPKKSLIVVFGITKEVTTLNKLQELIPCEACSMYSCQYRRKPYKQSRILFENAWKLRAQSKNLKK